MPWELASEACAGACVAAANRVPLRRRADAMLAPSEETAKASPLSGRVRTMVGSLAIIGLVGRIAPLFDQDGRLYKQFPSEDGYLTLTIARNMARGLGMSVSDGTIATNGTQPFVTWLWSLLYRAVGADPKLGVLCVQIAEIGIAVATALLLAYVGRRLLAPWFADARSVAAIAAAVHFAGPHAMRHSMNCLESGAYALAVLVVLAVVLRVGRSPGTWAWRDCIALGLALGWAFWVRNDAVFLTAAVCLVHWIVGARRQGNGWFGRPLVEAIVIGLVVVAVASPWLISNLRFGHLMPISGVAESHQAELAQNLHLLPTKLLEHALVYVAVPGWLEGSPVAWGTAAIGLAIAGTMMVGWVRRQPQPAPYAAFVPVLYLGFLCGYYGLFFGAGHFVDRYLFPASSFLALATTAFAWQIGRRVAARRLGPLLVSGVGIGVVLVASAGAAVVYKRGAAHPHMQVVEWVKANVDEATWVGAIQTGTLGYFHARTYNLDGKVSPEALERKLQREIPQYVVEKEIEYLPDWIGIRSWMDEPVVAANFEVLVYDEAINLCVLRRKRR